MRTILVVEDDLDFGGQLLARFEAENWEVRLARTGRDALRLFSERPADAVLVDVVLPGHRGLAVVEQLRALAGGEDVPVFLTSAVVGREDLSERELRRLGVVDFLTKPFGLVDLARRVAARLAEPEGGRAMVRALRRAVDDDSGVDLVTESMAAVPDFVIDELDQVDGDHEDFEVEVNGDHEDFEDDVEVDADESISFIDFETGSMATVAQPEGEASSSTDSLSAVPAPTPSRPELRSLEDFELDVEMGRSGTFEAVDLEPEPQLPGLAPALGRLEAPQPALPLRVASGILQGASSQASGLLLVAQDGGERWLELRDGAVVGAGCDPFGDGLPRWLEAAENVTPEQNKKLLNLHDGRGWAVTRALGAVLRRSPPEIEGLLARWIGHEVSAALSWTGLLRWRPGEERADARSEEPIDPVRPLWEAASALRLGRIELDLAGVEGRTIGRLPTALPLLDRLPETPELTRLQASLARPTAWTEVLPRAPEARETTLRLLWLLEAAGCLTVDATVEERPDEPTASEAELRIRGDWQEKMGQGPLEFLELPTLIDARGVRAAYAALSKRWRLTGTPPAHADTVQRARDLQERLREAFETALADLRDAD